VKNLNWSFEIPFIYIEAQNERGQFWGMYQSNIVTMNYSSSNLLHTLCNGNKLPSD
jgi:hypothetical protein